MKKKQVEQLNDELDSLQSSLVSLEARVDDLEANTGGGTGGISGKYATVALMLGDQSNQTEDSFYFVSSAVGDSTVVSGWAVYQKLATSTTSLSDYRKLLEQESLDLLLPTKAPQTAVNAGTDDAQFVTSLTLDKKALRRTSFGATITFTTAEEMCNVFNQTSNITIDADFTNGINGSVRIVKINGNLSNGISLTSKFNLIPGSAQPDNTKLNVMFMLYDSELGKVFTSIALYDRIVADITPPTIIGAVLSSTNSYVDLSLSEPVFSAGGVDPVLASAINLSFNQNSGTLIGCSIAGIRKNNGATLATAGALTGGETVIRVFLTLNGTANGSEFISLSPTNGASIYDASNNAMLASQTTGNINLRSADTTPPVISSAIMSASNSYIDLQVSEGIYTDAGISPVVISDWTVTFASNGGGATGITVTSITKNTNGALIGGETIIRFNLSVTGTPTGVETISIRPFDGSSVFDQAGNAMASTQTTGNILLINQSFSAEANAVFARMPDALTASYKVAMAKLIDGLQADGMWQYFDVFRCYAMNSAINAAVNWKDVANTNLLTTGSPTHNDGSNYQYNGTSQYSDSNFSPSTEGTNYSLNDAHFGVYIKEWNEAAGVTKVVCGTSQGTGQSYLSQSSANAVGRAINSSSAVTYTSLTTLSAGHWVVARPSSSQSILVKDGTTLQTSTHASNAETSTSFFEGARRGTSGAPDLYANCKLSFFHAGSHTNMNYTSLNNRLATFLIDVLA